MILHKEIKLLAPINLVTGVHRRGRARKTAVSGFLKAMLAGQLFHRMLFFQKGEFMSKAKFFIVKNLVWDNTFDLLLYCRRLWKKSGYLQCGRA